jgi:hypothetical protein
MSPMQAVVRPSALPVLKAFQNGTLSSPELEAAPSPTEDRHRRAGSTPTRALPAPGFFRAAGGRTSASTTAIPTAVHVSSLAGSNNNNNNVSKLKPQPPAPSLSARPAKTESVREPVSRRQSTRSVSTTSSSSGSAQGRNRSANRSETNPASDTNNLSQKSNLARCSITRAIITKLQPSAAPTKGKGTAI